MSRPDAAREPYPATRHRPGLPLSAAVLAAVILLAHGGSLFDGLFFDDHWHRVQFERLGWSWNDLIESATFDVPGELAKFWFAQRSLQWRYARPLAMAVMKLEYLAGRGEPIVAHAAALLWHWLAALAVLVLARAALRHNAWALLAAALFALNPHSVFAVSWIAARNALVGGLLLLAAVAAWWRYSLPGDEADGDSRTNTRPNLAIAAIALWLLALLAREAAVVFAPLILALDLLYGGRPHARRHLPFHAAAWLLTALYLAWRLLVFPRGELPEIYFTAPDGLSFALWAASRMLQLCFALVFNTPMFIGIAPSGGGLPAEPLTHAVMLVGTAAVAAWWLLAVRTRPERWFWPLWVLLAFAPVVPVVMLPHFAYVPAAALAIMTVVLIRAARGRWRWVLATVIIGYNVWSLALYRVAWRGMCRAEQLVYADIIDDGPPPPGSSIFLINAPAACSYLGPTLREAWGDPTLRAHILTFADHPLVMTAESSVRIESQRTLIVSSAPPGYFAGRVGHMLQAGLRSEPLAVGDVASGELFTARVEAGDESGLTRLRFEFHEPLDASSVRVYVSTPDRPAYRLRLSAAAPHELPAEHEALFTAARASGESADAARAQLRSIALPLLAESANPLARRLDAATHVSDELLGALEHWWRTHDVPALLAERQRWLSRSAPARRDVQRYWWVVRYARSIARTELLLTGGDEPPHP